MGLLGKLIRFITGQTRSGRISPKVELNNLPALKTFILEPIITPSGVVDSSHFSEPLFESGFFTVGAKGEVGVDYLFDGGGYEGELAIFSLKDLEQYDVSTSQGLHDFIQVVAERALSDSELGHIVISDAAEGARFSGIFPSEWHDWNAGEYQGVKTFNMNPGDTFGVMLVPNATVQELYDNPDAGGAVRPLFSMVTANPSEAFHLGQAVDVNGKATTFVLEDQRFDQGSDRDYEDIIFQFHGATGKAANMDNFVNHDVDWRGSELGQKLIEFIKPPANQPLIGIIDTGITADNPDLDPYHIHFGNHADLVAGDGNPLLQSGEGSEHGTHIAGIIAGTQNNGLGIDGINDQAPLYISRATGSGNWAQGLVDFVDAAKESGQPHAIANLSLDLTQINHDGSVTTRYEFTPFEREALEYARQNHVLIVAAAGNDGDVMSVLGQASQEFDNIITTGAAKHLDLPSDRAVPIAEAYDRADYSSYGYGLDILADGGTVENPILSTVGDGLGTLAGTSVATAQVTGAASLVWAANPDLDYRQVIEILKSTATDLKTPGWDAETGSGLLNIAAAVELAKRTAPEVYNPAAFLAPTTWDGEGQVLPWERAASDFVSVSFNGNVTADIGAIIRDRPSKSNGLIASRAAYGENLSFDGWVDGEYISYSGLKSTTKWYRIAGNPNQWISGAIIDSDPPAVGNNSTSNSQNNTSTENNNSTVEVEVPTNENSNNYTDIPSVTEPPKPTFKVSEPFYSVWQKYQGFIGSPIENVQTFSGDVTYQRFDNGSIVSSSHGTFALYGGIRQAYLNTGGLNGWLGAPTSPITEDPSHNGVLKQKFEHGYIIWNGNKASAYKVGTNRTVIANFNTQPSKSTGINWTFASANTGGTLSVKELNQKISQIEAEIVTLRSSVNTILNNQRGLILEIATIKKDFWADLNPIKIWEKQQRIWELEKQYHNLGQENNRTNEKISRKYEELNQARANLENLQKEPDLEKIIAVVPGNLQKAARESIPLILAECKANGVTNLAQIAYVLATSEHESKCGSRDLEGIDYMVEFPWNKKPGQTGEDYFNRKYAGRLENGNYESGDGYKFRGRGYAQITGKIGYEYWGNTLKLDLLDNPDQVTDPKIAAKIIVQGMKEGIFTSLNKTNGKITAGGKKKLSTYIKDSETPDFTGARNIINGQDAASEIAQIAMRYLKALKS